MKQKIIYTILNLLLISLVNSALPDIYSAPLSLEMILFNKKFIYLDGNSYSIQITEKNQANPLSITKILHLL